MGIGSRAVKLSAVTATVLAGLGLGVPPVFAASHAVKHTAMFKTEHVRGARSAVLAESSGQVVYTFTGDHRGKAATCTGECAMIWPLVKGVPVRAHGAKISGKFATINGQVTYNGLPLYLFTGAKPAQNHANAEFKLVPVG